MKKISLLLFIISSLVASDELNIELTNYTLFANANITIPKTKNMSIRGGYLYNDRKNKKDYYFAGFQVEGKNSLDNYNSKLTIFMDYNHIKDNGALPIGIGIINNNLGNFQHHLFAKFEIAYAPAVLSFDKTSRFYKTKIEIGIKPIKNAKLFIGYRDIIFNRHYQSLGYCGVGFIF